MLEFHIFKSTKIPDCSTKSPIFKDEHMNINVNVKYEFENFESGQDKKKGLNPAAIFSQFQQASQSERVKVLTSQSETDNLLSGQSDDDKESISQLKSNNVFNSQIEKENESQSEDDKVHNSQSENANQSTYFDPVFQVGLVFSAHSI